MALLGDGSPKKKTKWITIEPVMCLYAASSSLAVSLLISPQYIENRLAQEYNITLIKDDSVNGSCSCSDDSNSSNNTALQKQQQIAAETASWLIISTVLVYLPSLFISPLYGSWGDHLGQRKIPIIIPIVSNCLYLLLLILSVYADLPIAVYVSVALINGLGGGLTLFIAGCFSYITDVYSSEKARTFRFALLISAGNVSIGLVQLPFGYLVEYYGVIPPLCSMLLLSIVALVYIILLDRDHESPSSGRQSRTSSRSTTMADILRGVSDLFSNNHMKRRNRIGAILVLFVVLCVIHASEAGMQILRIYGIGPPFCWSSVTLGYFNFIVQISSNLGKMHFQLL